MITRIKDIIKEQLSIEDDNFDLDTPFESANIDSIDAVQIIMAVEDEFEIEIPDDAAEKFHCINDIVKYLTDTGVIEQTE